MNNVLFSILIANYNNGRYLMDAIKSVYLQTYTNWEIIIIDDASIDNSHEILKQLSDDKRIKIHINEKNKGVGDTKYRLAAMAQGELFAFLDADDRLEPNALEIMTEEHRKHPECSLINSTYRSLTNDGTLSDPLFHIGPKKNEPDDLLLCNGNRVDHFAVFKTNMYRLTKGADFFFFLAEDLNMYYKMEEVGEIGFIDMPLYQYRIDNNNSISLGSEIKQKKAMYYAAAARLDAYKRRIDNKSWRCDTFRKEYEEFMLAEIKKLKDNTPRQFEWLVIKFLWMYLNFMHFNKLSLKRTLKLVSGR